MVLAGHGKYESLGAFGVSVLLIGTGAGIAWNALEALQVQAPQWGGCKKMASCDVESVSCQDNETSNLH